MAKDSDWETIVPADDSGWETIIPANQGRGSINPPADAPLPNLKPAASPVAPARVLTRAPVAEVDTGNAMGADFGAAIMAQNPDAFTEVNRGSVMTGRRLEVEDRSKKPGFMVRPEYVDEVRNSFASVPAEKRRAALEEMAKGSGSKAIAAQRILSDIADEDKAQQADAFLNKPTIDALVKGPALKRVKPPPGDKAAPPAKTFFPDVSPTLSDIIDRVPEDERIQNALKRDEVTRGVISANTNLQAIATDPERIRAARETKADESRSAGEWAVDTLSSLAQGGTSLVQLPTNIIAPGSVLAQSLRDTQKELQAQESGVLKAQRDRLRERVENEEGFLGKYFATVKTLVTNPALSLSEATKQIPNFLTVMGLAKVGGILAGETVGLASRASPTLAVAEAISGGTIQAGAKAAGATAGGLTATTIMTSGDAAGNVYETLIDPKKTPRSLWEQNPDYQKLIAAGKSPAQAIDEIATAKARLAALIVAPLGVFGFMGAEATIVSRGAGKILSEVATPRGAAKVFGKDLLGEQVEEGGTQFGGNVITQTVNPQQKLLEGVPEAMATAAVTSAPFSTVAVGQQVRDELNRPAPVVDQQVDALVRRAMDVQSYDANIISPTQTARVNRAKSNLDQATTVDDMTGAANELAGNLNEMLVPENMVTPAPDPRQVRLDSLFDQTTPRTEAEWTEANRLMQELGVTFTPSEPALTGDLPPLAPGRVEPTLTNEPLTLTPGPDANVETEQQFGLDKLRMNAPRPQSIQGKPAASLTDDELSATIADSNVSAITRRSAEVELKARQSEQAPNVPAATTTATEAIPDVTGTLGSTPVRGGAVAPVSELPGADAARTNAQRSLDRWSATQGVASPIQFNPAPAEETAAVTQIGEALGSQFGTRLFAYHDTNPDAPNGVAVGGTAFVNTANVGINISRTSLHEFKHTIEQIARAEANAGLTNTPAQQFTTQIDSIFDDMTDAGKRAYVENFLYADELAGIADPAAREARVQELIAAPMTRSEMTADFLGSRATDRAFWVDVAKADPQGFKGFVDKWLGIIDGLLGKLRGRKDQGKYESLRVDKYIQDLNRAKMVARDALVAYRKGTLQQFEGELNGTTSNAIPRNPNIPGIATSARPELGEAGRAAVPSYGTGRPGAISVVGRHYSSSPQQSLSGAYYGRGLKGAERNRLDSSTDPRLKNRIYFYVDQGSGIRPESGVGGYAHEVKLDNIYDPQTGLIRPQSDLNGFESAVINGGFDGYIAPFGNNQAAVVLLGQKHKAVPVAQIGQPASAPLPQAAAPTTLKKGLLSREANTIDVSKIPGAKLRMGSLEIPAEQTEAANAELERIGSDIRFAKKQKVVPARVMFEVAPDPNNADLKARWEAVPFERKIEISQRVAEKIMPQVFRLAGVRAKMTTQLGGYLEDTSPSFAALLPSTASAEQLMDVARLGGFGLAQDSMMVLDSKPFKGSSPTGLITITLPENRQDQESVHAIYRDLRQVSPENISGHTTVEREMVLAVPSDSMDDLASKIESVLGNRPENFILKTGNGQMAFPSKEEYDYGQEGTGSPELLAKRAEARRIREEASAAIEAELAKDESTGGRKIDTGVYRSVADGFGLSQAEYNASALPLMLGGVKDKTFRVPMIGGIPETIQWLDQRYRDAGMPTLDINKAEDRTTLAKLMSAEAVAAIRSAGNAVEWYDETIDKMLSIMSVKYPELNTDPDARNVFLIAVAISSQSMNVEANLTFASSQYEAYRASVNAQGVGKFPEVGQGKSAPPMAMNFALANDVMADMGPDLLRRFLQTEFTKRELEAIGFSISGESMDENMLGSAIFGPKIGFGFYSNLSGNFEPITMDMWFMRLVGRLTGTLPAFDPVLFPKQIAKLREALAETGDLSRGVYASAFDPADVAAAQQTDEGAIALARKINSLHNRQFIKERAAFDSGARIKTALAFASNGIIKSADKPTDTPSSGGERQRLRDVTRQMVAMVEQQVGKRVPPAALQALVWYPEQELYKKLGVDLAVTSQDYAGAAKLLLTKEGFDEKRIDTAAQPGPRQARQVAGKSVAGANKQAGQPSGPTGPIKGAERETFIQTRIPLEDIFAGLNKRGLAKTRAEAAYTARPDGAQIKYVQENFLDILSELEDSDLVKINCD